MHLRGLAMRREDAPRDIFVLSSRRKGRARVSNLIRSLQDGAGFRGWSRTEIMVDIPLAALAYQYVQTPGPSSSFTTSELSNELIGKPS